jgi:hypothetical protein
VWRPRAELVRAPAPTHDARRYASLTFGLDLRGSLGLAWMRLT